MVHQVSNYRISSEIRTWRQLEVGQFRWKWWHLWRFLGLFIYKNRLDCRHVKLYNLLKYPIIPYKLKLYLMTKAFYCVELHQLWTCSQLVGSDNVDVLIDIKIKNKWCNTIYFRGSDYLLTNCWRHSPGYILVLIAGGRHSLLDLRRESILGHLAEATVHFDTTCPWAAVHTAA